MVHGTNTDPYMYTYQYYTAGGSSIPKPSDFTGPDAGTSVTVSRGTPVTAIHNPNNQVSRLAAHYYDEEAITIHSSVGFTTLKRNGTDITSGASAVPARLSTGTVSGASLYDTYDSDTNTNRKLPSRASSITLKGSGGVGVHTITIADVTPAMDFPDEVGPSPQDRITFTIYVVGPLNATGTTIVKSSETDGVERVSDQQDTQINEHFTFNPVDNQPVYYSVEGSGRLYVSPASDRKTSSTNNLYTSSSAPVYLDTNGGSSKVTAYIAGSGNTATVLYLFSGGKLSTLPKIEVQSGSPQPGAPSGQLDDYFEVRVTDGKRRPVSGVPVEFSTTPTSAMFIPVLGTRIYAAAPDEESIDAEVPDITIAEATSTFPAASKNSVQTDRNGVAKIHYQLSSTSG